MIVFDLHCDEGHRFEGWFGSSDDFDDQLARGLLTCPECGSVHVSKAPMAPSVPAKSNARPEARVPATKAQTAPIANREMPAEVHQAMQKLAEAQANALKDSTNVGGDFVKQSREMHYGERDEAPIHGQASLKEAKALVDEGVPVAPLPFPVAPPEKLN
ncbi:MAG: DUF1178 family protein [Pseudomonadota bacterium]